MQDTPVLILTEQDALWLRWQQLALKGCKPVRGTEAQSIRQWYHSGHQLVVLDASMHGASPWSDPAWRQYFQMTKVLVLSHAVSDEDGQSVLSKGAYGYGSIHLDVDAIARILWSLQQGAIWMGRNLLQKLLKDIDQRLPASAEPGAWLTCLSQREQEVAIQASTGHSNAEIAAALSITERTVRAHLSAVFEKLGVSDRLQLALKVHGIKT